MGNFKIPDGLSPEAQKLYRRMRRKYVGKSPAFAGDLESACRSLDRLRSAEATLQKEGATYTDQGGQPKAHPATIRVDREGKNYERQMDAVWEMISDANISQIYRAARFNDRGTGGSLGRTNSVSEEGDNE